MDLDTCSFPWNLTFLYRPKGKSRTCYGWPLLTTLTCKCMGINLICLNYLSPRACELSPCLVQFSISLCWWIHYITTNTSKGKRDLTASQLAFYVNLHRAVIGPSATLTGWWRPDIDLRRMLTGLFPLVWRVCIVCHGLFAFHFGVIYRLCSASVVPASILRKSISGRHRPVRVADGPMTARCRFT